MIPKYTLPVFLLIFTLPGCFRPALAQRDTTKLNQEVEVVKAYRPSVANAAKINLLPEINDTTRFRPDLNYRIAGHPVTSGFLPSALKSSGQYQREINIPGYGKISGGVGSYTTPFLDFYLSNPNAKNGTLGVLFNHLSSQGSLRLKSGDEVDAPFSYNRALVFGSYVYDGITIASQLSYQRDMNCFYGYPITIPPTLATDNFTQYFNRDQLNQLGAFSLSVKSNATSVSDLKFNAGVDLSYLSTSTRQVEKASRIHGNLDYNFGTFNGNLTAGLEHFETENICDAPSYLPVLYSPKSTWLHLAPSVLYRNDYLSLEGGLNLFSVFDNINGNSFKPYPKAAFSLHTADNNLALYAGLDGSLQNNSYGRIVEENRWINPALEVHPTSHRYILSGGLRGKIATPLAFDFGVKYGKTENQYFYETLVENRSGNPTPSLTDLTYNNAFEVTYDNLGTLDFSGELTYTTADLFLLLSGHFYNYQPVALEKAPYQPDFTLNAAADFRLTDRLRASAGVYLTGPRSIMLKFFVPIYSSALGPPPIYLKSDPMIEANIGINYQFMKHLEFFGKAENLLNRKDEPWYGYTVQGLRFKLGASFTF